MSRGWKLFFELYKEGKVTFSKNTHFGDSVSYRLTGFSGRLRDELYSIIIELTETVTAPYGIFSFIKQMGKDGAHSTAYNYESEKGLANDIYEHLSAAKTEPVWRTDSAVALWSYGHHRKLVEYLDGHCRSEYRLDPYWNGEFYMYGFLGLSCDAIWEELSAKRILPDLTVSYHDSSEIWIDFELHYRDPDEEKRICRLVKEACDRHGVKPILKNIDPAMMELGFEV